MLIQNPEARLLVSLQPSEEALPADDPPADQIRCVQTVEQTSTPIRFPVQDLLSQSQRGGLWERCYVEKDEFESVRLPWYEIKHLPGIHLVGETADDEFVEIAVMESYTWWLLNKDIEFSRVPRTDLGYDVSQPRQRDVQAHGNSEARWKADTRYIWNALQGINSSSGRGLDQYYRHYTPRADLLVKIEWGILIRDIRGSSRQVRSELAQSRFLALHLLKDPNGDLARQAIDADERTWIQHFEDLARHYTSATEAHLTEEEMQAELEASLYDLLLLRRLFELSGDRTSAMECKPHHELSVDESLARRAYIGVIGAAVYSSFDAWNTGNALSSTKLSGGFEHGSPFKPRVVVARKPRSKILVAWVGAMALTTLLVNALLLTLLCGKVPALLVPPIIVLLVAGARLLWNCRRRERVDDSRHYEGVVALEKVVID